MTRKHFKLIAEALKALPKETVYPNKQVVDFEALTQVMAGALACTNPNFDRQRFIEACK